MILFFEPSDQQTDIVKKYIQNYNLQGEIIDADEKFIESIEYAESKGTTVLLASKIAYDPDSKKTFYINAYKIFIDNDRINILTGVVNIPSDPDEFNRRYWQVIGFPEDSNLYPPLAVQTVLEYLEIRYTKPEIDRENNIVSFGSLNKNYLDIPIYGKVSNVFKINFSNAEIGEITNFKIINSFLSQKIANKK